MTKCISQHRREKLAERDRAIRAEGSLAMREFVQDCLLSMLADIRRKHVNIFELGAGWGSICIEVAGVIDYRIIPLIPTSYRCLAVEAEPTHYTWAKEHFEIQKINGIVVHGAVSNKNGTCRFDTDPHPDSCYGQAILPPFMSRRKILIKQYINKLITKKTIKIPTYTVDSLIRAYEFDHVDLMHIDVQGAEYKVMLGATDSIKNDLIDYLYIGTHHRELNDELRRLLSPKYDLVLDIYPRVVAKVDGFAPIRCHDGVQIYKRKNI